MSTIVSVAAAGKEDQFLRAAGRMRGARQRLAAGQRIDQARLADIGAAGEGDLDALAAAAAWRARPAAQTNCQSRGEQLAPGLDLGGGDSRIPSAGQWSRSCPALSRFGEDWPSVILQQPVISRPESCDKSPELAILTAGIGTGRCLTASDTSPAHRRRRAAGAGRHRAGGPQRRIRRTARDAPRVRSC